MINKFTKIVKRILYLLINNPKFLLKRAFLGLRSFVTPIPKSPISKQINGLNFDFDFNYGGKIKQMYTRVYQPIIVELLKKYLKKGDTFIDVGANIGYFSMLAAGLVGKEGQVHSFEPVPEYFEKLKSFAIRNKEYKIVPNEVAVGDIEKTETIYIKGGKDIGNNTFFRELLEEKKERLSTAEVKIIRLDKYIKENNLKNIKLIKIDVEGFELPALKGLSDYLLDCSKENVCPVIVCEIVPEAYSKQGYQIEDLFDYMKDFNYRAYCAINNKKAIDIKKIKKNKVIDVVFKFLK